MKAFWKQLKLYSSAYIRPFVIGFIVCGVIVGLYVWKLDSLVPGVSQLEAKSLAFSDNLTMIRYNPLNAPVTLLQYAVQHSQLDNVFALRFISVIFGLVAILAFHLIARSWFRRPVAWLSLFLFVTTSWLLHTSRLATPLALQTCVLLLLLLGIWLQKSKGSKPALFFGAVITSLLLYVPGIALLLLLGGIWQRYRIIRALKHHEGWFSTICVTIAITMTLPLWFAIVVDPALLRQLVGLPDTLPSVTQFIRQLADVQWQLFVRGPDNPTLWLGRLPLLEFFSAIMFVIGVYAFSTNLLLDRTRSLVGLTALIWLMVALGGAVTMAMLLPIVILIVASGIDLLLSEWLTVFPRNPLARAAGISIMTLVIGVVGYYHLTSYFVAWPNTPATKQAFNLPLK